ncbi:MAG TPA: preprotein translocase subunit SecA, partial [Burkholderiales bacterium]|nr:preprotein translocase subunit SecA [Burkholderiales bacterium]
MIQTILRKIFGSRNDRLLRQYGRQVRAINALEPQIAKLTDAELRAKTDEFRARIRDRLARIPEVASDDADRAQRQAGELKNSRRDILEELLPEAFAVVREAAKRTLNMRHFDMQLVGGVALHNGKIAEMRTGEGKTLVATLPAYLNSLAGEGVHIVTVNDYLASRDADWMGKIYRFLGLTVGVNLAFHDLEPDARQEAKRRAYGSDITYGTNNEFGFDYLRDNMVYQVPERVQRGLHYAIVDEVDSILIDEARTPLIISGQAEDTTDLYVRMNRVVPNLVRQKKEDAPGDYWVDEKAHQVLLSEQGHEHAEEVLTKAGLLTAGTSLYDPANIHLMHHLNAALRAHNLFHRDQQYVVQGGEIIIVDEFTGRLMPGRRWSEGLHQAVEAKEGVEIQKENQTLATITFQNYFRMYGKLAGMTGTADTEAYEFQQIYGLETVVIPTHMTMIREDRMDQVYRTAREKHRAIINDIKDCYERGQPTLVGTTSIENSELLSEMLKTEKLPHNVLNAKQHAREAEIVIQAGRPKMITIATNMAGRGTDIVLGGNPEPEINRLLADPALDDASRRKQAEAARIEWQKLHNQVVAAGGLHIVGTERHESRRIDNQLRGRSGRQGDPGESRFYLSAEDELIRLFAGDRIYKILDRLGPVDEHGEEYPLEAKMLSRTVENAQKKVEQQNFLIRKRVLEYDDVMNEQRRVIYKYRREILDGRDMSDAARTELAEVVARTVEAYTPGEVFEDWDLGGLQAQLQQLWPLGVDMAELEAARNGDREGLIAALQEDAAASYERREAEFGAELMRYLERQILLQVIDHRWKEHLYEMDYLREGIHLRGFAQIDPLVAYKNEGFSMFEELMHSVWEEFARLIFHVQVDVAPAQAEEQFA